MRKIKVFLVFALLFSLLALNAAAAYVSPSSITIKKAVAFPNIDGNLDPAEWGDPVWSYAYSDGTDLGDYSDQSQELWLFTNDPDEASVLNVVKNSKIDFYAMWDETYLYFGVYTESPIDVFSGAMEESDVANSWNARGIQFEYADKDGTFTDIGFGVDGAGNTIQFWFMGAEAGSVMSHNAKVIKNGTAVIYEIAMKWADINLDAPAAGSVFAFTLACNFHRVFDGDPFFGIALGGSEMTKNPDVFMPATLSADPAVVPPAPEPEPEPEPEPAPAPAPEPEPAAPAAPEPAAPPAAPTTGDPAAVLFALALSAALALTAAKRLKKFN
ncbi:MAG: hypothetical protein FWD23_02685 [Oscillospiraceae bacterium]|nr:hypothetical protein [Oscillospiraceae bacterium]